MPPDFCTRAIGRIDTSVGHAARLVPSPRRINPITDLPLRDASANRLLAEFAKEIAAITTAVRQEIEFRLCDPSGFSCRKATLPPPVILTEPLYQI
ncbi:hypothetical protein SKAU_G00299880 [Synaphobranchus kaupii]|uniref:Uncharacterized protein n=1 Tax=Synaphobranchus kaupii TaxID=118154 RepID=A0A9Q1EVG7_SYNKA|nr:hypothetical protein SKAU_G00299880 [Synaphobranchus kaupii]